MNFPYCVMSIVFGALCSVAGLSVSKWEFWVVTVAAHIMVLCARLGDMK